jgi:threonine/homoserine/homoserine lactone efflux protein
MTLAGFLVFLTAYIVAVASPGPAVATVMARALSRGVRGLPFFIAGIATGDMAWFLVAATGLAMIAQHYAVLLTLIKYAGAAYLLYLAWQLWRVPAAGLGPLAAPAPDEKPWQLYFGGLSLTLGNPKPIVFFMAILPTIVDLNTLNALGMAEISAVIVFGIFLVLGSYGLAADRARRMLTRPSSIQILNRTTAVVMAGAAAAVARA